MVHYRLLEAEEIWRVDRLRVISAYVLTLPLYAELCRRILGPTPLFLVIADLIGLAVAIRITSLVVNGTTVWFMLLALSAYSLVSIGVHGLEIEYVGYFMRPVACGLVWMVLGQAVAASRGAVRHLVIHLVLWSIFLVSYALLQLFLGLEHPINELPSGVEGYQAGVGDYGGGGASILGLFRPTSIFFHTGKFGQVAFFLALLPGLYVVFQPHGLRRKVVVLSLVFGVLGVLCAGQRAAIVCLFVSLVGMAVVSGRVGGLLYISVLMAASGLIAFAYGLLDDVVIILERYDSLLQATGERLVENLEPWSFVMSEAPVFGLGSGVYSFGSPQALDRLQQQFIENSWIRLIAELGIVGFALYCIVLFFVMKPLWVVVFRQPVVADETRFASLVGAFAFISVVGWSFTHDLFANALTMQILFGLVGYARFGALSADSTGYGVLLSPAAAHRN